MFSRIMLSFIESYKNGNLKIEKTLSYFKFSFYSTDFSKKGSENLLTFL